MNLPLCLSISIIFLGQVQANAEDLNDAIEIIKRAEQAAYYTADDGRSAARMIIKDSQGRRQIRQFTLLRKDALDSKAQDLLVVFSRPADIRGTVFRVHKTPGSADDRWLYLPGLDLVKRISASDKRTSFVGSHFFYEDISGRGTNLDRYKLINTSATSYHLVAYPKQAELVEFSRYEVTIDKVNYLPQRIEYFDKKNRPYRLVETLKTAVIDNYPTVIHSRVSNLLDGGSTEMQFRFIKYDLGIPQDLFSERYMRAPPQKWLNTK